MQRFSLKNIEKISGGDHDFVISIIETFKTTTPDYINQISIGIEELNTNKIKYAAHQLKPAFDIFEMNLLSEKIRQIETECEKKEPNMESIILNFKIVEKEISEILPML
jgi:HPt (histidine-containing phosphotransfer) domain-containing protein